MNIVQPQTALKQSITHYNAVLLFLVKMDNEIGTASETELGEMVRSLAEMHQQAIEYDQFVLVHLTNEALGNEMIVALLDERTAIVKEILDLNAKIVAKAKGVNSLLAHDIETLRTGTSALNGYRPQQTNHGRIVNTAS